MSPERVTASTCLDELGADSLAVVEMAELMEEAVAQRSRHRVRVDDVALVRARTFADLAGELSRSLARVPGVGTPHPASAERARGM
ncbi:MAG: acyl carrier protein [Streptosporangiales bacterium]|nr:acyl carrier protein [Streptosporangiales bacterium]MBO0892476.1 acyl carrier protein [Acidothermales bacterium]